MSVGGSLPLSGPSSYSTVLDSLGKDRQEEQGLGEVDPLTINTRPPLYFNVVLRSCPLETGTDKPLSTRIDSSCGVRVNVGVISPPYLVKCPRPRGSTM